MSLALALANSYGITMCADKRTSFTKISPASERPLLFSSFDGIQKLFMTKSGHGIAYTGTLILSDGVSISAEIAKAINSLPSNGITVQEELTIIKQHLRQHGIIQDSVVDFIGAEISNGANNIVCTKLAEDTFTPMVDSTGIGMCYSGEEQISVGLLNFVNSNIAIFSPQLSVDFLRFALQTVSGIQYYSGEPQTVSHDCDILFISQTGSQWITSQNEIT